MEAFLTGNLLFFTCAGGTVAPFFFTFKGLKQCFLGHKKQTGASTTMLAPESWQGRKDSNLRMPESKSGALGQLGDSPTNFGSA